MIIAINIHLPSLIVHQCHLSTPRVLWWVCLLAFLGLLLASLVWNAVEIFGWQQINLSQCTKYFQAKRCFLAALGSKIQTRSNDNSGSCCWYVCQDTGQGRYQTNSLCFTSQEVLLYYCMKMFALQLDIFGCKIPGGHQTSSFWDKLFFCRNPSNGFLRKVRLQDVSHVWTLLLGTRDN